MLVTNARINYAQFLSDTKSPGPLNDHGLAVNHGEYVVEQGYLVLTGDDLENTAPNHLLMRYISNDYTINLNESNMDLIKNGEAAEYPEIIGQSALNINGYNCYKILTNSNTSTWVLAGNKTYLQFARYKNGQVNWDNAAKFAFSPLFSDLSLDGGNGQTSITTHSYSIRSAETLNALLGSNFWSQWSYSDLKITFDLDIDYDPRVHFLTYSRNPGNNNAIELWNPGYTSPYIRDIKGEICANAYGGQLYTLRYITRQIASNMNTGNLHDLHIIKYMPADYSQYLIGGTSNKSKINNITIDDSTGLILGSYKGDMNHVTVNKLVLNNDINVASDPNKLWGIIGETQNVNISDLKISNVNFGNTENLRIGIFGKISSGTIDGVTVNVMTSPDNGFAVENYGTVKNVTVNNLIAGASSFVNVNGGSAVIDTVTINNVQAGTNGFADINKGKIINVNIRGLGAGVSGFVNNNEGQGTVDSVMINGATIGKYGFGEVNNGTISNCQIYGNRYESVQIGNEDVDLAVGFVKETEGAGAIKRSSVTGTVTGKSAAGFIGTQSNNNGGNYTEDCYSNVIINVTGGNSENDVDAAGFILNLKKGGVAGSHSLGIIRNTSSGVVTAAGFAGSIGTDDQYNTKFDNNYAAIWDNPGITNYGLIYVNNNNVSFTAAAHTIRHTIEQTVTELAMLSADQLSNISGDLTKAYRQYGDPAVADASKYPYSMPEGMTAYGDWSTLSVNVPNQQVMNRTYVISSYRQGVSEKGIWTVLNADGTALDTTKYSLVDNSSTDKDLNDQLLTFKETGSYIVRYEKKSLDGTKSNVIDSPVTVEPIDITVYYNGHTVNTVYLDSNNTGAKATVTITATAEDKLIKITSAEDVGADEQRFSVQVDAGTGTATVTFNNVGEYQIRISTANGDKTADVIVRPHSEYHPTDVIENEGEMRVYSSTDNNAYHFDVGTVIKIDDSYYVVTQSSDWCKPSEAKNNNNLFVEINTDTLIGEDQWKASGLSYDAKRGNLLINAEGKYYVLYQDYKLDQYYQYYNTVEIKFSSSMPNQTGDITGKIGVSAKTTVNTITAYFNNDPAVEITPDTISVNESEASDSELNISSNEGTTSDEVNTESTDNSSSEQAETTDNRTGTDLPELTESTDIVQNADTSESAGTNSVESSSETTEEGTDPSSSPVSAVSDIMMHRYATVRFVPYQFSLDEPGSTEDPEGEEGKDTSTVVLPGGTTGFSVDASPVDTESSEPTAEPAETSVPAETDAPEETIPAAIETAEPVEDTAEPVSEETAESSDNKPDAEYDVVTGETFDLSVMNPVRKGYTLIGWRVLNAGEDTPVLTASVNTVNGKQDVTYSYATDAVITVTGDLQLEAVWSMNETAAVTETADGVDLSKYMNSSTGNPYPLHWDNCTWSAWTLCKAYTGISLPGWGDAKYWYARAQKAGFKTGSAPSVNSIVCFDNHVGFVSAVSEDGQYAYIQEGNWGGTYHEGWWPAFSDRHSLKLYGYIYLGNYEPNAEILVPDPEEIEKQAEEQQNQSEDIDYNDPVSSEEPEVTPTPEPTATAEPTATPEHTAEPTPEQTAEPTPTPTPEHTAEPTPTPTPEQTAEPTPADTPESTATPEVTAEPEESPAEAAVPEETAQPTPEPTALETEVPEETAGSEETAVPEETVETPEPVVEETPAPEESVDPYEAEKAACTEPSWWNDADHVCVVPEPTEEPVVIENSEQPVSEEAVE